MEQQDEKEHGAASRAFKEGGAPSGGEEQIVTLTAGMAQLPAPSAAASGAVGEDGSSAAVDEPPGARPCAALQGATAPPSPPLSPSPRTGATGIAGSVVSPSAKDPSSADDGGREHGAGAASVASKGPDGGDGSKRGGTSEVSRVLSLCRCEWVGYFSGRTRTWHN